MAVKRKITKATAAKMTIQDAFDEYIEEKRARNLSYKSIENMKGSFKKWMRYLEEENFDMDIENLGPKYLFSFQSACLSDGLKPTSLNHYLRDIRAFVYWCEEHGYLVKGFKIEMVKAQESIIETYTDEEKRRLIAKPSKYAGFVEWRSWAIVNWILATGHRAGTVCAIKLGDVNYRRQEIAVRQTKTNKAYITPLSSALSVVLKEYVRTWRVDATDDDYLFCNVGDEQLTVNALKHSIRDYNHSRGVDRTSIHAFRHTFAKDWIRNSGDVFRLQKLLGHSSLEMTRHYVNMFSEDLKEGFDDINPLDRLKRDASRKQTVKRNEG